MFNVLIYKMYRQLTRAEVGFSEPRSRKKNTYVDGGFVESKPCYNNAKQKHERQALSMKRYQIEALDDISALLKKRGITLKLVFAPIAESYYSSFDGLETFAKTMRRYAEYYDFNELVELDEHLCFKDQHHLNQRGVELFDEKLIELLL